MKLILSVEPIRFPLTGIGRYTYELVRNLQDQSGIDQLLYLGATGFVPGVPRFGQQSNSAHKLKRWAQQSSIVTESYRLASAALKAHALRSYADFIFHGPNFFLPRFSGRKVATFHDLSPFKWPQCLSPLRARYLQKELTATLNCADVLITDSAYTRLELADYFSWPLDRIYSVPLASSPEFHPRRAEELRPILNRYGLAPEGYTLFVGTIEPRKNIETLLDAYGRLPLPLRKRTPLVLCGYQGWQSASIHARIKKAETEGWARYIGFAAAEDLPYLFAGACLFAFPSHYEGFGLPVLEAMSSGVPVVCSDSTSLPEVAGNAALMCAAEDVEGLTQLLSRGLTDQAWREVAIADGLQHSFKYSWSRCAVETTAVYRIAAKL
ncbi:alpha-1,3-rhamnosyl/mannosyltransferase [Pollutimonas bauzanensis]|uniref:Alpha-1,3-rhamnosyl/mannosyltransferase n=2 Tax=Pollutimonas bauzanensis TaxID=658167 RepID=A0A1M6BJV3_9BURK|nr:alpha-1,3-rhamnosyl/mannosyltransferase [Pollutimonas bauzanensis]